MDNFVIVETQLVVDENGDCLGTIDDCYPEDEGQIIIEVELKIPQSMFLPPKFVVTFPENPTVENPIVGIPQMVEMPVELLVKKTDEQGRVLLEPADKSSGFFATVKTALFGGSSGN